MPSSQIFIVLPGLQLSSIAGVAMQKKALSRKAYEYILALCLQSSPKLLKCSFPLTEALLHLPRVWKKSKNRVAAKLTQREKITND